MPLPSHTRIHICKYIYMYDLYFLFLCFWMILTVLGLRTRRLAGWFWPSWMTMVSDEPTNMMRLYFEKSSTHTSECEHAQINTHTQSHARARTRTHTCTQTHIHACRQTGRQADRQTDSQADMCVRMCVTKWMYQYSTWISTPHPTQEKYLAPGTLAETWPTPGNSDLCTDASAESHGANTGFWLIGTFVMTAASTALSPERSEIWKPRSDPTSQINICPAQQT